MLHALILILLTTHLCTPAFSDEALACPACKQMNLEAPEIFSVVWRTTMGDFTVHSERKWAPKLVDRLWNLVVNGFYQETAFYRVLPGFVCQWGVAASPRFVPRPSPEPSRSRRSRHFYSTLPQPQLSFPER